jgi:putative transcriptional regulator
MKMGQLLVATPKMPDMNFRKTLVLLVRQIEEGTMGLILNRPTNETVGEVWASLRVEGKDVIECTSKEPLYLGGPVFGPICAIHKLAQCSEHSISDDLYWSSDGDNLNVVVANGKPFRIFTGYTSWNPGQLEKEIEYGGWVSCPVDENLVFAEDNCNLYDPDVWRRALHTWGASQWNSFGIMDIPQNISVN